MVPQVTSCLQLECGSRAAAEGNRYAAAHLIGMKK